MVPSMMISSTNATASTSRKTDSGYQKRFFTCGCFSELRNFLLNKKKTWSKTAGSSTTDLNPPPNPTPGLSAIHPVSYANWNEQNYHPGSTPFGVANSNQANNVPQVTRILSFSWFYSNRAEDCKVKSGLILAHEPIGADKWTIGTVRTWGQSRTPNRNSVNDHRGRLGCTQTRCRSRQKGLFLKDSQTYKFFS